MSVNIRADFGSFLRACFLDYKQHLPDGKISERIWIEKVNEWHGSWHAANDPKKVKRSAGNATDAEKIYALYPRKIAKADALKSIVKALSALPFDVLAERVTAYANATARWKKEDKAFIPHPSTWFNRGSYDDDPNTWHRDGEKQDRKFVPVSSPDLTQYRQITDEERAKAAAIFGNIAKTS